MLKQIRTVTVLSLIALVCINTVGCGANSVNTSIADGDLSNGVSNLSIDSIKDISEYFIDPHEHESMKDGYTEEYDLNGDGKEETISIEQLPCNGGDGAYYPHVYNSEGVEIAYQDDIEESPFKEKWDNGNVEFYYNDEKFYSLDKAEVKSIYLESATEEEIDKNLSGNQEREADLASGFVVSENDGKPELIVKYYTEGVMPHVVSLGYCLLHLKLNNDEKWEITPEFVRDGKSNTDAQVIIPALDYYWAKDDSTNIYYFSNKKLYSYDKVTSKNTVVTENIMDPYDFAVYDGTIYTLENSGEESNPLRLYIYDKYADNFDELLSFENQVHSIHTSGHYLIAKADGSDKYEIYDITVPDSPQKVDANDMDIIKETPLVKADDANENIIYQGQNIADINQFDADSIEVWGWNDKYVFVNAIIQGQDNFYKIELDKPENVVDLGNDISKLAVFDDLLLIRNNDGSVEVVK